MILKDSVFEITQFGNSEKEKEKRRKKKMAELLSREGARLTAEFSLWRDPVRSAEKIGQEEFLSIMGTVPSANNCVKILCEDLLAKKVYQIQEMNLCRGDGKGKSCIAISFEDRVCLVSDYSGRDIMPLPIARFYLDGRQVLRLTAETKVATLFG